MQKVSQGANWTENADNPDKANIAQAAYFLLFTNGMRQMRRVVAERGGFEPLNNIIKRIIATYWTCTDFRGYSIRKEGQEYGGTDPDGPV